MRKTILPIVFVILFVIFPRESARAESPAEPAYFPHVWGQTLDRDAKAFAITTYPDMTTHEFVLVSDRFTKVNRDKPNAFEQWVMDIASTGYSAIKWQEQPIPQFSTEYANMESWLNWVRRELTGSPVKFNFAYGLEPAQIRRQPVPMIWVEGNYPDGSAEITRLPRTNGTCRWAITSVSRGTEYRTLAKAIVQYMNTGATQWGILTPEWHNMKSFLHTVYWSHLGCGNA